MPTDLTVEWVATDTLFENPANPRINDAAVPHVAASIRRFGWQQPLVCRESGEIVAGHTRLKAARELGMETVPVVRFTGSDLDAVAYGIADNRTHEHSTWNEAELAKLLAFLKQEDALDGVGYSAEEIATVLASARAEEQGKNLVDPGPVEPVGEPVTRLGDMWLLDQHALLCGSSDDPAVVARVMAGATARLFSTDPPYAVSYDGSNRPVHDGKKSGKDWSNVYHETDIKDLGVFLDGILVACLPHIADDAAIYMWHAHMQQPVIAATFERHEILFHQVLVWTKPCPVFGHSYYQWGHEPCAFGWRKGHKPEHGSQQLSTVWTADWDGRARFTTFHPTSKPTRLFEIPMEQHTKPGDIVLEPFSGSGSQLVAAEKLGRRCRAIELSPVFVDGTIDRWQQATGKKATLDGDGRTFEEIAAERKQAEVASV